MKIVRKKEDLIKITQLLTPDRKIVSETIDYIPEIFRIRYKAFTIENKDCQLENQTLGGQFNTICKNFLFIGSLQFRNRKHDDHYEVARQVDFAQCLNVSCTQVSNIMKKLKQENAIVTYGYKYYVNPVFLMVGTTFPLKELAYMDQEVLNIRSIMTKDDYIKLHLYRRELWDKKPF